MIAGVDGIGDLGRGLRRDETSRRVHHARIDRRPVGS
jgi:hypothetical protein